MSRFVWISSLLLACSLPAGAEAFERGSWADVTRVEPITRQHQSLPAADCAGARPAAADLAELLAWDLHSDCRTATYSTVSGYRVNYSWDGRNYSVNMDEHPGERIALRLRIR